jgi:hypothetical protein
VPYRGEAPALTDLLGGQVNASHCFPINAHDMRAFAMPASQNLDQGSAWEAVGAGSGTRQRPSLALRPARPRPSVYTQCAPGPHQCRPSWKAPSPRRPHAEAPFPRDRLPQSARETDPFRRRQVWDCARLWR